MDAFQDNGNKEDNQRIPEFWEWSMIEESL